MSPGLNLYLRKPEIKIMITNLLWRCPLCKTEDALVYTKRRFIKPERLLCTSCSTAWEFTRTDGEDYYWQIVEGKDKGLELGLADWYQKMKEGFRLVPLKSDNLELLPGEELYLTSKSDRIKLLTQKSNPLFSAWNQPEFPFKEPDKNYNPYMKSFGVGKLFLTSRRFLWKTDGTLYYFYSNQIMSVYAEAGFYLGIFYGSLKYKFRFQKESLVKWLIYTGAIAKKIHAHRNHKILVSNY